MKRWTHTPLRGVMAVALVAVAGLAFIDVPLLDAEQFGVHLDRWRSMDDGQRLVLRDRWRAFQAMPEARRAEVTRRFGALRRLNRKREAQLPDDASADALRLRLGKIEALARTLIVAEARSDVAGEVRASTVRRVRAFLTSLVRQGRIDLAQREAMLELPHAELLRESLALQKSELIALYESTLENDEAGEADDDDLATLRTLEPVEVVDRLRDKRQKRGLLGEAGRVLALPDIRRERVAAALQDRQYDSVLEYLRPHVRELLESMGLEAAVIEETLQLPYAQLERRLERLLRSSAEAARRPSRR